MGRCQDYKVFLQYLLVAIAANVKMAVSHKLLVNARDSEHHEAVISDSEVYKADVVCEVQLLGEIDDELDEVSEIVYDAVSDVGEADQ